MRFFAVAAISLSTAALSQAGLVSFDFTGTDPGMHTPWTTTSSIDANVDLAQGIAVPVAPVGDTGMRGKAGNDAFYAEISVAGGVDNTLADALTDNLYASLIIAPKPGYSLNLAGATLSADLMRGGSDPAINDPWHAARELDIMSSIEGFDAPHVLATALAPNKWDNGIFSVSATFPNTAAYTGITTPVEFRFYFSGEQWGWKGTGMDNVVIGGTASVVPEPATLGLVLASAGLLIARRRVR